MMNCWFCHWGWPKPIAEIYQSALAKLDGYDDPLLYGPSNIVWDDENFDLTNVKKCLARVDDPKWQFTAEELGIVRESLEKLAKVDQKFTDWPEEYDGENPQDCPPPAGWEMVKL